jgi:hypothetical protein
VLREWPDFQTALGIAAASYALAGRLAEARSTRLRLQKLDPQLHLSPELDPLAIAAPTAPVVLSCIQVIPRSSWMLADPAPGDPPKRREWKGLGASERRSGSHSSGGHQVSSALRPGSSEFVLDRAVVIDALSIIRDGLHVQRLRQL